MPKNGVVLKKHDKDIAPFEKARDRENVKLFTQLLVDTVGEFHKAKELKRRQKKTPDLP